MAFLARLQKKFAIVGEPPRGRASVKDQLGQEEEESSPQEGVKTKPAEEAPPTPAEQPQPKEGVQTGKALLDQEGRFAQIKQFKPYLFIVSGVDNKLAALMQFFASSQTIFGNTKLIVRIAGPDKLTGKERRGLDMTLAYLVASNVVNDLSAKAKGLPVTVLNFDKDIAKTRPFDAVALSPEIESKLGDDARRLRGMMQKSLESLKAKGGDADDGDTSLGEISALQMQNVVPIDYMRFLTKENSPKKFYTGGTPEGAGQNGMLYILADRDQSNLFMKTMKEFHPLPNFEDGLYFLPNIDSGFKTMTPRSVVTDNCLILEAKTKFEIHQKLQVGDPQQETNSQAVVAFSFKNLFNTARLKKLPLLMKIFKGKETSTEEVNFTVLDALNRYGLALAKLSPDHPAGQYVQGTHVQGTLVAHFSRDFKRCILWCGHQPIDLTPQMEAELKLVFNLVDIDKTFIG